MAMPVSSLARVASMPAQATAAATLRVMPVAASSVRVGLAAALRRPSTSGTPALARAAEVASIPAPKARLLLASCSAVMVELPTPRDVAATVAATAIPTMVVVTISTVSTPGARGPAPSRPAETAVTRGASRTATAPSGN